MKNWFKKLPIKIIMVIILILITQTNSLRFHEIGGLLFSALFFIHIAFHRQEVITFTKSFLTRKLDIHTSLRYIVDVLLFLTYMTVTISGVLMAMNILPVEQWKATHVGLSTFAYLLIIVHIAQHWKQIAKYFLYRKTQ